ncbi:MAG: diaminopimelate decarboxylase [Candidatus Ancillula sp.]|jgi:diaminopimelate decarboxylase|nr:diaminopimelate decarboxylase [Candidatus Ancillula sp.]
MNLNGIEYGEEENANREEHKFQPEYDAFSQDVLRKVKQHFDTPTFVFSADLFQNRMMNFNQLVSNAFNKHSIKYRAVYAGKAFLSKNIVPALVKNGFGIDTCSYTEIMTAIEGGAHGEHLGLHGNNKSEKEILFAFQKNFRHLVIDSMDEISMLEDLVGAFAGGTSKLRVMIRITTGVHAGGHSFIATAHEDQKFGISMQNNQAIEALTAVLKRSDIFELVGIHTHIGSQITSPEGFLESAERMLQLRQNFADQTNHYLREIDLGGGFGIQYCTSDEMLDLEELMESLSNLVAEKTTGKKPPLISFEPGRWLIGPCMGTLYTIGTIKDIELEQGHTRRYISVDGGMSDNIRPALYQAKYSALVFGQTRQSTTRFNASSAELLNCRIVGKHCESGDILVDEIFLPPNVKRGDLLFIPITGAYGYSMASNYNGLPKPGVVQVSANSNGLYELKELIPRQHWQEVVV